MWQVSCDTYSPLSTIIRLISVCAHKNGQHFAMGWYQGQQAHAACRWQIFILGPFWDEHQTCGYGNLFPYRALQVVADATWYGLVARQNNKHPDQTYKFNVLK